MKDVYVADTPAHAATLLDKAIVACSTDEVVEVRSLGTALASWRAAILAHQDTGASNGPTEGLNLCVRNVKRCGLGYRSFERYRLRVLLHAGGVTWPERARRPTPPNPLPPLRRIKPPIFQKRRPIPVLSTALSLR